MGEVFIRYIKMDISAIAFTATDSNGDYNIYVNTAYNYARQQEAIRHEMRHINMNHFYSATAVTIDEKAAESGYYNSSYTDRTNIEKSVASTPLEKLRLECGLCADKAARLRGISKQSYFLYEKGLAKCPPQTEHKIISALLKCKK